MKKILALLLAAALLGGAALAETDEQTRTRDITVEGVTAPFLIADHSIAHLRLKRNSKNRYY